MHINELDNDFFPKPSTAFGEGGGDVKAQIYGSLDA